MAVVRMSGAYSKPMPWSGGGATKPPMANNYLDSHGLNPGISQLTLIVLGEGVKIGDETQV